MDFSFEGTRKFLLWHMAALTLRDGPSINDLRTMFAIFCFTSEIILVLGLVKFVPAFVQYAGTNFTKPRTDLVHMAFGLSES